jgi:hypothetical protein
MAVEIAKEKERASFDVKTIRKLTQAILVVSAIN